MARAILLPVDLGDPTSWAAALPEALAMAGDGALHVLSVIPDFGVSVVGAYFDEGFGEKALADVGDRLTAWVNDNVPPGVDVHPHVTIGRIYDEIIRAADALGVDTIVVGASPPGPADYLLGPNAARVVRHARQSVYVVRGPAPAAGGIANG